MTAGRGPLSEDERAQVLELVGGHEEIGPVLKYRGRAIAVAPHFAARGEAAGHVVVVVVYDYDADRTLVATVDPSVGEVGSVAESPVHFQLSTEERREAEALALEDQRARELLGGRDANPLTRLYFPPHADPHRYAVVFLRPGSSERAFVVVDLSERRVVEVKARGELGL